MVAPVLYSISDIYYQCRYKYTKPYRSLKMNDKIREIVIPQNLRKAIFDISDKEQWTRKDVCWIKFGPKYVTIPVNGLTYKIGINRVGATIVISLMDVEDHTNHKLLGITDKGLVLTENIDLRDSQMYWDRTIDMVCKWCNKYDPSVDLVTSKIISIAEKKDATFIPKKIEPEDRLQ